MSLSRWQGMVAGSIIGLGIAALVARHEGRAAEDRVDALTRRVSELEARVPMTRAEAEAVISGLSRLFQSLGHWTPPWVEVPEVPEVPRVEPVPR